MTEAPERIWINAKRDMFKAVTTWSTLPLDGYPDSFIRLDAHEAAVAAARKEGMLEVKAKLKAKNNLDAGMVEGTWQYFCRHVDGNAPCEESCCGCAFSAQEFEASK